MDIENERYEDNPEMTPLDKQEKEILQSMKEAVLKGEEEFAKWERSVGNKVAVNTVKFSASIKGKLLKDLMYLKHVVCDGYKLLTKEDVAKSIVEMGIAALMLKVGHSQIQSLIQYKTIMEYPPEMRDALMTVSMREAIKSYVKASNKEMPLSDLLGEAGETVPKEGKCFLCNKQFKEGDKVHQHEGHTYHEECLLDLFSKKGK